MIRTAVLVSLPWLSFVAAAENPTPGRWEIAMEVRAGGDAAWSPGPMSITQCVTAADAADPSRLIASVSTPGATGCEYTERSYSGNTLRFAMSCAGAFAIRTRGNVTFGSSSFEGEIVTSASVSGDATEFRGRITGRRLGGC